MKTLLLITIIFCLTLVGVSAEGAAESSVPATSSEANVLLVDHNTTILFFLAILFVIFAILLCITSYRKRKR
ncbi:MAG: hypothetical protein E7646_07740 [Ruminococcaceae bacterium]|nr:hypothetical protein [Oscillospiraceae bacterium]